MSQLKEVRLSVRTSTKYGRIIETMAKAKGVSRSSILSAIVKQHFDRIDNKTE